MTNEQILKLAIEKAEKTGFNVRKFLGIPSNAKMYPENMLILSKEEIIFSHDFAKAFWGEEWKDGDMIETPMSEILSQENIMPWQHHLRRMVLEPNPLDYISKFL